MQFTSLQQLKTSGIILVYKETWWSGVTVVKMSTSDPCHYVVFFDKNVYSSSFLSTNEYPAM